MATRPDPCQGWILLPARLLLTRRGEKGSPQPARRLGALAGTPSSDAVRRSGARASLGRGFRVFGVGLDGDELVEEKRFDNLK